MTEDSLRPASLADTRPAVSFPLKYKAGPAYDKPGYVTVGWRGDFSEESSFTDGKRLREAPMDTALSYLLFRDAPDGKIVCEIGKEEITFAEVTIHHRKDPQVHIAKFLGIACFRHNSKHQAPYGNPPTTSDDSRERKYQGGAQPEASSLESAKHDPQRAAWDEIIDSGKAFKELERLGLMTDNSKFGKLFLAQDLSEIAVSLTIDPVFGKYSSETFMRYAREDRFDKLEMIKDKGRWWVKPR